MSIFMRCLTKMVITEYTQSFQTDRQTETHTDRQMAGQKNDCHRRYIWSIMFDIVCHDPYVQK